VNVQGDEPFVKKCHCKNCCKHLKAVMEPAYRWQALCSHCKTNLFIADPNYVKVVVDKNSNALLFSRSAIPYARNENIHIQYYEHIGVYAFRKETLLAFSQWPVTPLEAAEKIECLRYLENGIPIKMVTVDYMGIEIDTPEDLERAAKFL